MAKTPIDAFGSMAASLSGDAAPPASPGDTVRFLVGVLRGFPEDDMARFCADGFQGWLDEGGDLQARLGLRPRRGGAQELPKNAEPQRRRNQALRELAASVPATNKAQALAALVKHRDPLILRIEEDGAAVPKSASQIKRILRGDALD